MTLTKERLEQFIALSKQPYTAKNEIEFIEQCRNLMPQLAHDWLQKDAEIQRKDAQIQRIRKSLKQINSLPVTEYSVEHLSKMIHTIRPIAHQALADIDAGLPQCRNCGRPTSSWYECCSEKCVMEFLNCEVIPNDVS